MLLSTDDPDVLATWQLVANLGIEGRLMLHNDLALRILGTLPDG